jgi:hypothetical protein
MATILEPATEVDFKNHLDGSKGLGIIPVNEKGLCYFGAIDIDIDTIDHRSLYESVSKRNLPLSVCRSKSGGAHLYAFFQEPTPATTVQSILRKWAGLLGFPSKTEIFPKQTRSSAYSPGNWINLPYFSSDNTVRYGVDSTGSLSLRGFLGSIKLYTGEEKINEGITSELIQIDLMPPCLKELTREGLPAGTRNIGLFNFAVFYRKSSPNGWQDKVRHHNQNYLSPPLSSREVDALLRSVNDRVYQYQCETSPLCDYCDRKTCLTTPYGVGHKPWKDDNNFDEILVTNLRKILTDPPSYIVEINGKDLWLATDEFRSFEKLRKKVFETHDAIIRPIKQPQWEQKIKELFSKKTDIEAPEDASQYGATLSLIDDFLSLSDRSKSEEDILRGTPIKKGADILFQVAPLQQYLLSKKLKIDNKDLFAIIHRRGCSHQTFRIKGKVIRAWTIPTDLINKQSENYTETKFERPEPEI